ncbi:MAG TPA: Xaa-Pro dipeptidase [Gammaproteobacteria bacterium]|nr:Xaa-Pro dipeptidase [Gammaproteobacteria bacterium]
MTADFATTYPAHIDTIRRRFDAALAETGYDRVIIYSGGLREHFLDDSEARFKVNPHFNAWLPVTDNPYCFIIYEAGQTPILLFYRPEDFWHKPPEAPDTYWTKHFDIRFITQPDDIRQHLSATPQRSAFIGEGEARFADWKLGEPNPKDLLHYLHYDRAYKTDYELACQRAANRRGVRGHLAAADAFHDGASEFEILLTFLKATDHTQEELPYGAIIALNDHGAALHYQLFEHQRPEPRHSFLIDSGASVNGYASDITRTYSAADDEFAELIAALDEDQQALGREVRPGVDYRELHQQAHQRIARLLRQFDFVRMEPDAIVETGISSTFLPHGLGHFLGLQVHDVGGFQKDRSGATIPKPEGHPFLRLTRTLEPREVLTIEPGLYFIAPLLDKLKRGNHSRDINWEKVDAFRRYGGIRIEDNVVVTEGEPENLTRDAFAAAAATS